MRVGPRPFYFGDSQGKRDEARRPTGASAAGEGARPSVPSMGRISLDERSQPEPMTATVAKRKV